MKRMIYCLCLCQLAVIGASAEPPRQKLPLPDAAARAAESKKIADEYAGAIAAATTATDKFVLADKLIAAAGDAQAGSARQFELLRAVRDLAVDGGGVPLAFEAIDRMDDTFQINAWRDKADAFAKIAAIQKTEIEKRNLLVELLDEFQLPPDAQVRRQMFRVGCDLAAAIGDIPLGFRVIDEIGKASSVENLQSKADMLATIAAGRAAGKAGADLDGQREIILRADQLLTQAVAADRYAIGKQCTALAAAAAKGVRNPKLIKQAALRAKRLDELATLFDRIKDAVATLAKSPADPAANMAVGRFRCYFKVDWRGGLPLLARGGDPLLAALAERDLSNPQTAGEQLRLADAWWDFPSTGWEHVCMLDRAAHWYRRAAPRVDEKDLARVKERLKETDPVDQNPFSELGYRRGAIAVLRSGDAYASRRPQFRPVLAEEFGGTRKSERAVAAALGWLARHQSKSGSWSLKDYDSQCADKTCTGPGSEESLAAATAFGLLPFLAAGQAHDSGGPYQGNVGRGIYWLIDHQKPDGNLYYVPAGEPYQPHYWMYSHALAAIALCECYGMTGDIHIAEAAQRAIDFIEKAQNETTGGWRYSPGDEGDTSVLGWQLTALKSAAAAGLKVDPVTLPRANKWLTSVETLTGAAPNAARSFAYQPNTPPSPSMTAVGVLCCQGFGDWPAHPAVTGGVETLLNDLPDEKNNRNVYYWYYATQAMHNMADDNWDIWNCKMRAILIDTQERNGCAAGSWNPDKPARDAWGQYGGRLMVTSLSALTLEVYYRSLPLCPPDDE